MHGPFSFSVLTWLILGTASAFSAQLPGPAQQSLRLSSSPSDPGRYFWFPVKFVYPGSVPLFFRQSGSGGTFQSAPNGNQYPQGVNASSPQVALLTWTGLTSTNTVQAQSQQSQWTVEYRWGGATTGEVYSVTIPIPSLTCDMTWSYSGGSGVNYVKMDPTLLLLIPGTGRTQIEDPYNPDYDGDGIPNHLDWDDDNDGIADENDPNPRSPKGGDPPILDLPIDPDHDHDGDGVPDRIDPAPDDPLIGPVNNDMDGDGIPNDEDADRDGDGVLNQHDSDPDDPLVFQPKHPSDPDDGDKALDTDGDGIPDYLDSDDDNDGLADVWDPNPKVPSTGGGGTDPPTEGPGSGGQNGEGEAHGSWNGSNAADKGVSGILQTGGPSMTGARSGMMGKLSGYEMMASGQIPKATSYTMSMNFGKFGTRTLNLDFTKAPFPQIRLAFVVVFTWMMGNAFFKRATV